MEKLPKGRSGLEERRLAPNGLGLMEHRGALGMSGLHHPQLEETVQLHLRVELLALIATKKDFTFVDSYFSNDIICRK